MLGAGLDRRRGNGFGDWGVRPIHRKNLNADRGDDNHAGDPLDGLYDFHVPTIVVLAIGVRDCPAELVACVRLPIPKNRKD